MNTLIKNLTLIQSLIPNQKGIFFISDLKKIFGTNDTSYLNKIIKPLLENRILNKFMRGVYVTPNFSIKHLAIRISPNSVISFANVLADNFIIGTVPKNTIYILTIGKTRKVTSPYGQIFFFGVTKDYKHLLTIGRSYQTAIPIADKEKAFLDTLYFYQKGHKFYFNIYSDINYNLLDKNKINQYLKKYQNPIFIKFVKGLLNG